MLIGVVSLTLGLLRLGRRPLGTRSLQSYDPPDLPVNWVTAAFDALSGRPASCPFLFVVVCSLFVLPILC